MLIETQNFPSLQSGDMGLVYHLVVGTISKNDSETSGSSHCIILLGNLAELLCKFCSPPPLFSSCWQGFVSFPEAACLVLDECQCMSPDEIYMSIALHYHIKPICFSDEIMRDVSLKYYSIQERRFTWNKSGEYQFLISSFSSNLLPSLNWNKERADVGAPSNQCLK